MKGLGDQVGRTADALQRLTEMERKRTNFTAELLWQGTKQELDALRAEALVSIVPGAGDFAAGMSLAMDARYSEFLDALPAEQQGRFIERIAADRNDRFRLAAADVVRARAMWYESAIVSAVGAAAEEVALDPARIEAKRQAINDLIDEADLPEARLAELRREVEAALNGPSDTMKSAESRARRLNSFR
jgi:hypothetical protein